MWGLAAGLAPGALPCSAPGREPRGGAGSRSRLRRRLCPPRASPLRRAAGGLFLVAWRGRCQCCAGSPRPGFRAAAALKCGCVFRAVSGEERRGVCLGSAPLPAVNVPSGAP